MCVVVLHSTVYYSSHCIAQRTIAQHSESLQQVAETEQVAASTKKALQDDGGADKDPHHSLQEAAERAEAEAAAARMAKQIQKQAIKRGITPMVIERERQQAAVELAAKVKAAKAVCYCCVSADNAYIYGCVPMTHDYILPGCLHLCLCPHQRCDIQWNGECHTGGDDDYQFLRCAFLPVIVPIPTCPCVVCPNLFWPLGWCALQSGDQWASFDPLWCARHSPEVSSCRPSCAALRSPLTVSCVRRSWEFKFGSCVDHDDDDDDDESRCEASG